MKIGTPINGDTSIKSLPPNEGSIIALQKMVSHSGVDFLAMNPPITINEGDQQHLDLLQSRYVYV